MNLKTRVLYLVSLAAFLRSFAQVIYVPSEVTMRGELNTTTAMIGLTLSVYGLFLAFSQIAYGPIVDRFDSKRVLLVGTVVFVAGSLGDCCCWRAVCKPWASQRPRLWASL
jgi:DHA1 family bicyclomycin/chloramphenicol resistance-like MFS transporter